MDNFDFYKFYRIGMDMAYKIPKSKIKFIRGLCIAIVLFGLVFLVKNVAFAQSYTTYDNLLQSNTNASNLLSLLPESAINENYVVFRSSQYEYCLAYGDLEFNNGSISGSDITVIKYDSQYSTNTYTKNTDNNFRLSVSKVVTSNMDFDMSSKSYSQYNKDMQHKTFMVVCIFLPLILAFNLRGVIKNEYV